MPVLLQVEQGFRSGASQSQGIWFGWSWRRHFDPAPAPAEVQAYVDANCVGREMFSYLLYIMEQTSL